MLIRYLLVVPAIAVIAGCGQQASSTRSASDLDARVPATPRAVVAATLHHLDGVETSRYWGQEEDDGDGNHVMYGVLSLGEEHSLMVMVASNTAREKPPGFERGDPCARPMEDAATLSCTVTKVDGARIMTLSSREDITGGNMGDGGVMWAVATSRHATSIYVTETLTSLEDGWRQGENLPVSLDAMRAIATDPLIDTTTSTGLVTEGAALEWVGT